jgi:hypothetical protein
VLFWLTSCSLEPVTVELRCAATINELKAGLDKCNAEFAAKERHSVEGPKAHGIYIGLNETGEGTVLEYWGTPTPGGLQDIRSRTTMEYQVVDLGTSIRLESRGAGARRATLELVAQALTACVDCKSGANSPRGSPTAHGSTAGSTVCDRWENLGNGVPGYSQRCSYKDMDSTGHYSLVFRGDYEGDVLNVMVTLLMKLQELDASLQADATTVTVEAPDTSAGPGKRWFFNLNMADLRQCMTTLDVTRRRLCVIELINGGLAQQNR